MVCFHIKLSGGGVLGLKVRLLKPEARKIDHRQPGKITHPGTLAGWMMALTQEL